MNDGENGDGTPPAVTVIPLTPEYVTPKERKQWRLSENETVMGTLAASTEEDRPS